MNWSKNKSMISAISLLTVLVWYKIVDQGIFGEGYYYFDRGQDFFYKNGTITSPLVAHDAFARIIFDVLPPVFQDNIPAYLVFQLVTMIILNISFFWVLLRITDNKWVSFTSAIFFLTSYIGSFEMLGTGNYQRFAQRIPQMIPMLFSFLYLHFFLQTKKYKNYFISVILFIVSIMMGHFATFMLPLIILYPLVWAIKQKSIITALIKVVPIVLSFVIINFLVISRGPHFPGSNTSKFPETPVDLGKEIILQIANINLPPSLIEKVTIGGSFEGTLNILVTPFLFIYLFGIIVIKKRAPELMNIYLASLIAIPIFLFLNIYLGKVDAAHNINGYHYYFLPSDWSTVRKVILPTSVKGDRYYFVPLLALSIVWSTLIWTLFSRKMKVYKVITASVLVIYVISNTRLIWKSIDALKPYSDNTKIYVSYIKSLSNNFDQKSVIVTPRFFLWPSTMIREFYGQKGLSFVDLKDGWEENINSKDVVNTFVIDFDPNNKRLIDLTEKFRSEY